MVSTDGRHCVDDAQADMDSLRYNIDVWASYSYEDNYSSSIMRCKSDAVRLDKKIVNDGQIFYRLILWAEQNK